MNLLVVYYFVGYHPFSLNTFVPLSVTVVFALGFAVVRPFEGSPLLEVLLAGLTFGVVVVGSLVATGSLDESDAKLLAGLNGYLGVDLTKYS
jgi:Flp pilus assembly protein protease CpaA